MRRLGSDNRQLSVSPGTLRKLRVAIPALIAGIGLSLLRVGPIWEATPRPTGNQAVQTRLTPVPEALAAPDSTPPSGSQGTTITPEGAPSATSLGPAVNAATALRHDAKRTVWAERLTVPVSGKVIAYPDGRPIPDATVLVTEHSDRAVEVQTKTDSGGSFSFPIAPSALFDLRASAEGFKSAGLSRLFASNLGDGVVIKLNPLLLIRGRVARPDGSPVDQAVVWAQSESGKAGRTKSDSRGLFLLDRIETPDRYTVYAAHPAYRLKAPASIEIPSKTEIQITMQPTPPEQLTRIDGAVFDDLGNPLPGAELNLMLNEKSFGNNVLETILVARSDFSGRYEFAGVRPARYSVSCDAEGFAAPQHERQKWIETTSGETRYRLDFRLWPESTLSGLVSNEEGTPVARARVLARPVEGPGRGTLSDQEGRFTLRDLAPGRHQITVEHSEYVKYQTDLDDPREREIRVVLRRGAFLAGVAYGADGRPLEKFALRFVRTADGITERISRHASPDGVFQVRGLEGGEYQVTLALEGDRLFAAVIPLIGDLRVALIADEASQGLQVRTLP